MSDTERTKLNPIESMTQYREWDAVLDIFYQQMDRLKGALRNTDPNIQQRANIALEAIESVLYSIKGQGGRIDRDEARPLPEEKEDEKDIFDHFAVPDYSDRYETEDEKEDAT